MKVVTAATILLVLISVTSIMNYSYGEKTNTTIQNASNLPTPAPIPMPIPPPGSLGMLEATAKVLGGNNKPSDFTINVSGNNPSPATFPGSSSGTTVTLKPGTYSVSASGLSGYTTTYSSGCTGSINEGKNINCTVTNQYTPTPESTTLNVVTRVNNTNGGTKQPSDFTINVSGNNPSPATFPGSSSGVSVRLNSGTYEVTQNSMPDYSTSYSSGCSGTANGVPISCIVTSQYQPTPLPVANLLVTKNVISNDRGTKKPSDFMIFVTGNSPSPNNFHGSTSGTSVS